MTCEKCGEETSTQFVTFQQNIGLFFVRFPSQLQANLCMNCIHVQFWKMTLICMVAGWWGIISAFTNITFILNNISQYSAARVSRPQEFKPVPRPERQLHPIALARIEAQREAIKACLESGANLDAVCAEFPDKALVPAGDIRFYVTHFLRWVPEE